MTSFKAFISSSSALVLACAAFGAQAQSAFAPSGVFLQGGASGRAGIATAGLTWDTPYRWNLFGGRLDLQAEASAAWWRYRDQSGDGHDGLAQLAVVPVLRWRGAGGSSPWFAQAGIGLSVTSKLYHTPRKMQSTAFNFADQIGVGRSFGARGEHEIQLRVEHFSNGGIKEPNPGATFGELRYAYRF